MTTAVDMSAFVKLICDEVVRKVTSFAAVFTNTAIRREDTILAFGWNGTQYQITVSVGRPTAPGTIMVHVKSADDTKPLTASMLGFIVDELNIRFRRSTTSPRKDGEIVSNTAKLMLVAPGWTGWR